MIAVIREHVVHVQYGSISDDISVMAKSNKEAVVKATRLFMDKHNLSGEARCFMEGLLPKTSIFPQERA
tara:strand:- start:131 stop:337 length:207 start_codon:yes stop_codon:yes gene_type:complete